MLPKNRPPTSPSEMLVEEFLRPLGMTQKALAESAGLSVQSVNLIIKGKRGVTAETALRLARVFKSSPQFLARSPDGLGPVARSARSPGRGLAGALLESPGCREGPTCAPRTAIWVRAGPLFAAPTPRRGRARGRTRSVGSSRPRASVAKVPGELPGRVRRDPRLPLTSSFTRWTGMPSRRAAARDPLGELHGLEELPLEDASRVRGDSTSESWSSHLASSMLVLPNCPRGGGSGLAPLLVRP